MIFKSAAFVLCCFTVEEVGILSFQLVWLATLGLVDLHCLWYNMAMAFFIQLEMTGKGIISI